MNERIVWQEYAGKTLVYVNFQKLSETEIVSLAAEYAADVAARDERELVGVIDVSGGNASPTVMKAFENLGKAIDPYMAVRGVIGISGFKKALLKAFRDLEEVKASIS